ncbi:helix-turn-helix transcriptional regulator [Spongiivirga citrea]|uniref:Helix-turn-helix domain-containing protein n=1 Tax=Spongiivirga citrea TaxID=1481457 RepID=A0A6M0CS73_9FLAO|nr:helix-turn-helix transcriptional regulator [Spongiivirga citrea]NER16720.1 helix-turn-helix domain-containing protein [Spongiivirga citrea]
MVNSQEFGKRIKKIQEYYQLSASALADALGIQRSTISHILSGRNKPSLDFVLKVVDTYPEVELYWLLNGKGNFPSDSTTPSPVKKITQTPPPPVQESISFQDAPVSSIPKNSKDKVIERIVIFYTDGSFKSFSE